MTDLKYTLNIYVLVSVILHKYLFFFLFQFIVKYDSYYINNN